MNIDTSSINNQATQQSNASSRQLPDTASASVAPVKTLSDTTQSVQQSEAVEKAGTSVQDLQATVEKMNELMQNTNRSVRFSVDDSADGVVVKVVDQDTDEVVRQIPSEEQLKFSEFLQGMVGMIFDEKA